MIRLVAIVLLCFAVPFGAAAEEPDFPQYNFLFIIDCSISMASRKPAVITLVRDLVGSGFNHRIAEGDSIDIWTYDTELHVNGFPPQIWDSHWGDRIANSAADYVEHAHLRGRSRSLSVRDDLGSLVLNTKGLMVLLITDGEESISGVGFDDAINDQLPKLRRKLTLQTQPFLISLSAINGRFSDWRIFGGLGRPPLAKLPNRQKPSAKEEVEAPKPAAAAIARIEPPEQKPLVLNFPPGAKITPAPQPVQPPVTAPPPIAEAEHSKIEANTSAPVEVATPIPEQIIPSEKTTPPIRQPIPKAKTVEASEGKSPEIEAAIVPVPERSSPIGQEPPKTSQEKAPLIVASSGSQAAAELNRFRVTGETVIEPSKSNPVISAKEGLTRTNISERHSPETAMANQSAQPAAASGNSGTNAFAALGTSEFVLNPIYFATAGGALLLVLSVLLFIRRSNPPRERTLISESLNRTNSANDRPK